MSGGLPPELLASDIGQCDFEFEVAYCVRGVVSPLLCNVYLDRLDRAWKTKGVGRLVRYADDLVVMCATRQQAEYALGLLTDLLAELGLEPKASKTRIVHLEEGGEGFEFLGFHHRWVRARSQHARQVM